MAIRGSPSFQPNHHNLPSCYLTVCHGKSPFLIGKPSISMGHLYHGYVRIRGYHPSLRSSGTIISRHLFRALNSEVEKHRRLRDERIWRSPCSDNAQDADAVEPRWSRWWLKMFLPFFTIFYHFLPFFTMFNHQKHGGVRCRTYPKIWRIELIQSMKHRGSMDWFCWENLGFKPWFWPQHL